MADYLLWHFYLLFQIDEDLTARINMADAKFSFQEKGRIYQPAWMSPEGKFLYNFPTYVSYAVQWASPI